MLGMTTIYPEIFIPLFLDKKVDKNQGGATGSFVGNDLVSLTK